MIERDARVAAFRRDGHVVIPNLFGRDEVASLKNSFLIELHAAIRAKNLRPTDAADPRRTEYPSVEGGFVPRGGNQELNRWMLNVPSRLPFLQDRYLASPAVLDVVKGILGDDCVLCMIRSDTALPDSGYQATHQDHGALRIAVNIALVDIEDDMGPLEVWPGTHLPPGIGPEAADWKLPHRAAPPELRNVERGPPVRMCVSAGSVIIRDHRQIHRGSPNRSRMTRPMITLVFTEAPKEVPYATATEASFLIERGVSTLASGLRSGRPFPRLLAYSNALRVAIEFANASDRDGPRAIPQALWSGFSPELKGLLRYAAIEGGRTAERTRAESLGRTQGLGQELFGLTMWFAHAP